MPVDTADRSAVSTDEAGPGSAAEGVVTAEGATTEDATTEGAITEGATTESTITEGATTESPAATVSFGDLGLAEAIVRKLAQNGVVTPFPIQAATIPDALAGRDILGRGRTGSGKTLAFGLPLLTTLSGGRTAKHHPRGVILTPTRELAMQVSDALQPYGDLLGLKLKVVCGGTSMANQIYALERGVDVLVATPGRLRDLIDRGACSLDSVQIAVLDEADQMADMGFLPEVTEILDLIPAGGQRMLFSATLENEIDTLVKRYLVSPVTHEVDAAQGAVTTMTHHVLVVKPKDKAPVTAAIAARKGRTIIFVRTQMGADRVAEQLRDAGVTADALHGGMTQGARTRTLADFKDGYVNVLVATDVAARGIHVDGIDLVLNVDPAGDHKDYLHRSGRTARAGQSGTVVSLALPHQRKTIFRLMEDAGVDASRHIVGGAGAFDEDVATITGARSLTEVQADAAANAAQQAEREVTELTRELEKVQRRAVELREEADRLTARASRERGDTGTEAAPETEDGTTAPVAETAPQTTAPAVRIPAQADRRDPRGNYERRPSSYSRDDRRTDDRRSDDRRPSSYNRDDRRPAYNRDERRPSSYSRDDRRTDDRRSDDRRPSSYNRDDRRPAYNRDDRRPAYSRDDRRTDDRRSDDRRPSSYNRDDRRPAYNRDDRRPSYGRHDDRRGSTSTSTSTSSSGPATNSGSASGSRGFDRRTDKPRWKRNG